MPLTEPLTQQTGGLGQVAPAGAWRFRPVGALTPGENPQLDRLIAAAPAGADWTKQQRQAYEWYLLLMPNLAAPAKQRFNALARARFEAGVQVETPAQRAARLAREQAERAARLARARAAAARRVRERQEAAAARAAAAAAAREAAARQAEEERRRLAAEAAARAAEIEAARRQRAREAAARAAAQQAAARAAAARAAAARARDVDLEDVLAKVRRMAKKSERMNRLIAEEILRERARRKAAGARELPFVLELRNAMQAVAAEHPGLKQYDAIERREYV